MARAATPVGWPIEYRTGDYRDVAGPIDFVVSSAVAHHMTDDEIHAFLRFMEERATRGWMVNDIHRGAFAYHGFPLLARLLGAGTGSSARTARSRSPAASARPNGSADPADAGIDPRARGSSGASPSGCASNGCADRRRRAGRGVGGDRAGAGRGDAGADRAQPRRARPGLRRLSRLGRDRGAEEAGARSGRARRAGRSTGCGWSPGAKVVETELPQAGRRPVAPPARRDPAAHGRGGGRGGAARADGAGAGGRLPAARRRQEMAADALFLATGKHELRGAARADRRPRRLGRPARRAAAVAGLRGPGRDDRASPLRRRLCRAAAAGGRRRQSLPLGRAGAHGRRAARRCSPS